MIKKIIFFILLVLISIGLLSFFNPGTQKKTITVDNQQRSYLLHLPKNYNSDKKYPLVIMLHGYSDHPRLMEFYTGMSKKADKEGFIVVYPKGTNDAQDNNLSWNADFCCGGARREKVDDESFIHELIGSLKKQHSTDSKSIFIAGFSNGGMLAHKLGSNNTSGIKAMAIISSSIGGNNILLEKSYKPLPVLLMNGSEDRVLPFNGGGGKDGNYTAAIESVNFWKENNRCTKNELANAERYIKTEYLNCSENSNVIFYEIKKGKHVWFGGKQEIVKNLFSNSVWVTDEIWEFFKLYPR